MNEDPDDVALWRAWAVLIALAMCFNIALIAGCVSVWPQEMIGSVR